MNTEIPSFLLSGRAITSLQAHALCGPAPISVPARERVARPAVSSTDVDGRKPPAAGDLRLMATLDAASRKPGLDGAGSRACSGVLQASFFDGSAWHRFDLPSLVSTHGFKNAAELDAALRWARTAATDAAGRVCERRSIDKSMFREYTLASRVPPCN
jgi:hypothetical protein